MCDCLRCSLFKLDFPPDSILANETHAQQAFNVIGYILSNYNGSVPASLVPTGQSVEAF